MANLTLTVDESLLKKARIRALEEGTSVNALVREYLERYAGETTSREEIIARIEAVAKRSRAGSGGRRTWTRESAHDRSDR